MVSVLGEDNGTKEVEILGLFSKYLILVNNAVKFPILRICKKWINMDYSH